MNTSINIGKDFSRYPAGRFPTDGKYNRQSFRQKYLVEPLREGKSVDLYLDDAIDYGSSFLEEAFGGLVRVEKFDSDTVIKKVIFHSDFKDWIDEIKGYIIDATKQ